MNLSKAVLFMFVCAAMAQGSAAASPFADANAKYQAGDFKGAAAAYGEIARENGASAAVYYNLGNAQFRLGKKGNAMVSYLRALRLAPRDADTRWNLHILKSTLQDRIEPAELNWLGWFVGQTARVTSLEAALALAGSLAFLALLSAGALFFPPARRPLAAPRLILLLLLVITGTVLYLRLADEKEARAVVLGREVYVRYGPSLKETKAFTLHEGAVGRVSDQTRDWLYLRLTDKNAGWVPRESCEIV